MIKYILKKIGYMIVTLWVILTITFFLMNCIPGDPTQDSMKVLPEAVANITSVTTQKTLNFQNAFGNYFYYTVKPDLFFGFKPVMLPSRNSEINSPQQTWLLAHPEKALLDLLYLYPFYNNEEEIEQLRLDEDFLQTGLDLNQLNEYLKLFDNKSLNRKIKILEKIYDL